MSRFDISDNIFKKEEALLEEWIPDKLPEREQELDDIAFAFHPIIRSQAAPHNLFVYGKSGQGKTVGTEVVLNELQQELQKKDINLTVIKASFKDVETEYQAVGEILTHLEPRTNKRPKGHSLGNLNKRMFKQLDRIGGYVVLVLDEIDNLGTEDDLLYQIPRARSLGKLENTHVSLVGISNDLTYREKLSAKVKGTLCDMEVNFRPYNAEQLTKILEQREKIAFEDDVVEEGVIKLCAALAAKDEGSARQAIKFLHRAGEIASRRGSEKVTESHLRDARDSIEQEKIISNITSFTTHYQATLLALALLEVKGETPARTKKVYSEYKMVAKKTGITPLTSRSMRDKLRNLDTYSMVVTKEKSGGLEGGKYYESELNIELEDFVKAFEQIDRFKDTLSGTRLKV